MRLGKISKKSPKSKNIFCNRGNRITIFIPWGQIFSNIIWASPKCFWMIYYNSSLLKYISLIITGNEYGTPFLRQEIILQDLKKWNTGLDSLARLPRIPVLWRHVPINVYRIQRNKGNARTTCPPSMNPD